MPEKAKVIFALLFASPRPLSEKQLIELAGLKETELQQQLKKIQAQAKTVGLELASHNDTYQLVTQAKFSSTIKKLMPSKSEESLSNASLEVLSIVAYKQPIAKSEIDHIRGVTSDQTLKSLLSRKLIVELPPKERSPNLLRYHTSLSNPARLK